jgi:hypothetical protein
MVAADSPGREQLRKVTQRHAIIQVVELEFARDATVPVYLPTILTKGSTGLYSDESAKYKVKEESMDCSSMDINTPGMNENHPCADKGFEHV